jgi:hypothetical protein
MASQLETGMSSGSPKSSGNNEDYTHQLAIKLSRALNIVNPNDLLARRVTDIAKTNSVDGFIKGTNELIEPVSLNILPFYSCQVFWQVQGLFSS